MRDLQDDRARTPRRLDVTVQLTVFTQDDPVPG